MKVGKFTAIFLSVVFFVILASVIAISIGNLFPGFSFTDNWFVRIILLFINFIIAKKFYDFIYGDVEVKEGKNEFAVYSNEDKKRKIAVFGVLLVFIIGIVYISAGVLFLSDTGDNNSVSPINRFNNQIVSFNYSANWSVESNNSTDIVLLDNNGYYLYIFIGESDGYTLDEIYNLYKASWNDDKNISIVNSTNIMFNNVPAIETYINKTSNKKINMREDISFIASFFNIKPNETNYINSYELLMVKNGKYYTITYYYSGNSVNEEEFKIFQKSFKIM
jgi:hypothetical protein